MKRANFRRWRHAGTGGGAPVAEGAGRVVEFLKNTINTDKFLKLFRDRSNGIQDVYSIVYVDNPTKNVNVFQEFIELKNFSGPRICAHLPAFPRLKTGPRRESAAQKTLFPDPVEKESALRSGEQTRTRRRDNEIVVAVVVRVAESEIHDSAAQLPRAPGFAQAASVPYKTCKLATRNPQAGSNGGAVFVFDHQNLVHTVPVDVIKQHARADGEIRHMIPVPGAFSIGLGEEFMDGHAVGFRTGEYLRAASGKNPQPVVLARPR